MNEHDDRLRELGSQLPWDRPDATRRDAVRSALLVAAAEGDARPRARWQLIGGAFAAGALAAAAVALLLVRAESRPAPVASAARIDASPAARLERQVTRTPTGVDEVVRLRAGSVDVAMGALRAGDHVRVATRDAEVEGDGRYAVVVVADALDRVEVADGHATIRVTGQHPVFLAAGETWRGRAIVAERAVIEPGPAPSPVAAPALDPVAVPAAVPTPVPRSSAPPAAEKHVAPAPRLSPAPAELPAPPAAAASSTGPAPEPTPAAPAVVAEPPAASPGPSELERRFEAGLALLRASRYAEAARELLAAADAGDDAPLAADARYFAAVAFTKAGRKTEAERALVAFLDHAPHSIRRGRAAVMLARLIAERGDHTSARAWFESALGDADASVVAAAKAGLAALP